jgi:hypothetical protein
VDRALLLALAVAAVAACSGGGTKSRELDHDLIEVTPDAKLRTDTIGEGKFAEQATFVLVDAENHGTEGAYVTLGGELADGSGAVLGELRPQSLWLPPGEQRTFALVDRERKPRPSAAAARILVRGANIPTTPPPARVDAQREVVDEGRIVVQGTLHNDASRAGQITVIASFHDADHKPMTRPFSLVRVEANGSTAVQFVGPPGSQHGTIFVGDTLY